MDFVFIDGNQQVEPIMQYFNLMKPNLQENAVVVFADIHKSKGMEHVWNSVKNDEAVTLTIDLFQIGLVFFRKEQKRKQHFIVQF